MRLVPALKTCCASWILPRANKAAKLGASSSRTAWKTNCPANTTRKAMANAPVSAAVANTPSTTVPNDVLTISTI